MKAHPSARVVGLLCGISILAAGAARPARADDAGASGGVEEIIVLEKRRLGLDEVQETSSRLGLTAREVPATLDTLTQAQMLELGLDSAVAAYNAAPGVTAGNLPALPGETSIRGFNGGSAVSYLFDGVHLTNSGLMSRNWDSWNFERIEILKGPGSVLHGESALAGAINLVPKKPRLGAASSDFLVSAGSFGSTRVAAGSNLPLGDTLALRGDVSWKRADGFVDDTDSETQALTTGVLWTASERLTLSASVDYFSDDFGTAYWGTPLVPASRASDPSGIVSSDNGFVVDEDARDENYNVGNGQMESKSYWLRTRAQYEFGDDWTLTNELSYFDADREWRNSEDYTYDVATDLLDRSTTIITHDQQVWLERAFLSYDGLLAALKHRFSIGAEYSETNFFSNRRFGETDAVDPMNPERGVLPADTAQSFESRSDFDSDAAVAAAFAESALSLGELTVVTGVRYDHIRLDRAVDDLNASTETSFGQEFDPISWRAGAVYSVLPSTQLYAQYSYAVAPVSSLLLINEARAVFDLSTGSSVEAGVKTTFWGDRAALTASLYRIEQDDILTRDPVDTTLTVQGGRQSARGVELSLSADPTDQLHVEANGALLQSEFDELVEAGGADRSGNRPRNVPEQTFNASAQYRLEPLPVTLGIAAHHAGDFYTDNANGVRVDGHLVFDASIRIATRIGDVVVRGRNLTDELYADWSGFSSTQVYLGAPRGLEIAVMGSF